MYHLETVDNVANTEATSITLGIMASSVTVTPTTSTTDLATTALAFFQPNTPPLVHNAAISCGSALTFATSPSLSLQFSCSSLAALCCWGYWLLLHIEHYLNSTKCSGFRANIILNKTGKRQFDINDSNRARSSLMCLIRTFFHSWHSLFLILFLQ